MQTGYKKDYYRLKNPLTSRECHFCHKVFTPVKSNGEILCSRQCKVDSINHRTWKKVQVRCSGCGNEFYKRHATQKFCSSGCSVIAKGHRKSLRGLRTRNCLTCGTSFIIKGRKTYCSIACKPKIENLTYVKECVVCGKQVNTVHKTLKYCSPRCARRSKNAKSNKGRVNCKVAKSPCESCGFDNLAAIHRHHINPDEGNAGGILFLCANCHYIYHDKVGWNGTSEVRTRNEVLDILRKKDVVEIPND